MKRIDFEHGTITGNILGAALPMLVAQLLSLLYNIVDRIYIARIPDVGTTALGAVGLCFLNQPRRRRYQKSRSDHEYLIYHAVRRRSGADGSRPAVCSANS